MRKRQWANSVHWKAQCGGEPGVPQALQTGEAAPTSKQLQAQGAERRGLWVLRLHEQANQLQKGAAT